MGQQRRKGEGDFNDSTLGCAHGSCLCRLLVLVDCPAHRAPYPGTFPVRPGGQVRVRGGATPICIVLPLYLSISGRDARVSSVGRLIPVSGQVVSRTEQLESLEGWLLCTTLGFQDGQASLPSSLDATRNPVVDGDQSRSEQVHPPSALVMMAQEPILLET
jgi:hypothetical protein